MDKRKVIQLSLIFSVTLLLTITVASAGFADWVKSKFSNEPLLSPFNASVTIQSVAPKIPTVINITDSVNYLKDQVDIIEGGTTEVIVYFVAHDDNGVADLPEGDSTAQITLSINKTGGDKSAESYSASSCNSYQCDSNCNDINTEKIYSCTITGFPYYSEPSTTSTWHVEVAIRDNSGTYSEINDTKEFQVLEHGAIALPDPKIAWTTGINPAGTNQPADVDLLMENIGNKQINQVEVTAYNLTGDTKYDPVTNPMAYLPASMFSADGLSGSECDVPTTATALDDEISQIVDGFNLDYGAGSQETLYFCIYDQLNLHTPALDLTDTSYSTNTTYTNKWEFTYTS